MDAAGWGRRGLLGLVSLALLATGCSAVPAAPAAPASRVSGSASGSATGSAASSVTTPASAPTSWALDLPPVVSSTPGAPVRLSTPRSCAVVVAGFDCDFQRRITAVQAYLSQRPGTVGIVLRDRSTGAVWRSADATLPVWTASTIKLGIAADLLERQRRGAITLTSADQADLTAMLTRSDNDATDRLWFRYDGTDRRTFNRDLTSMGMTGLAAQSGFGDYYPYWGFQKCTPADLDRLLQYVLTTLAPADRDLILTRMQAVPASERWGVWAAGAALHPGAKNGWSVEQSGWVINSVGFAGTAQRYTLSVMNSLNGAGQYADGVSTVSTVSRLLLAGRP